MSLIWQDIAQQIQQATGIPFGKPSTRPLGGGSINATYQLSNGSQLFFVKCNLASQVTMFEREAAGLQEISRTQTLRIPRPICWGIAQDHSFLVLEHLDLGTGTRDAHYRLGQQLARMHQHRSARFGWHLNNTIGSTPQINTWHDDWIPFYRQHRLGYQLQLARQQGHGGSWHQDAERLQENLSDFFTSYQPTPALLHGDLWGGNFGITSQGEPVIFDPAVYFGDRETDLAMTELFGGFPSAFYQGYQDTYPLDPGYGQRKPLYQLYHLLNHLNLFGSGYLGQVIQALERCTRYCSGKSGGC